ncbi:MAG: DUF6090 family protein [Eudoraea sp.]|uniref:DUF6090 family protein n=1 Tax=Eudoraea sp. TaxID=1979955 RepID=UPI003265BC2D
MIGFFRKIRKQLADDNKPLKYARYAIGEIALVVVGILIALSINNWNEERKEKDIIENFLGRVRLDLAGDKAELVRIINIQKGNKQNIEFLLKSLEIGSQTDKIILDSMFISIYNGNPTFFPVVGTYHSALSSGTLRLIRNDILLTKIVSLYDSYNRLDYNGKTLDNKWYKMNEKYKFELRTKQLKSMSINEITELKDDLNWYYITVKFYIDRCTQTLELINEMLEQE